MADVYLAEQESLKRQVAVKVLKRELADDETYVRRFHNEAQAAAALVHANIVQIHDVGRVDNVHFIAQEYVKGQNLGQLLGRCGPLEPAAVVGIMRQVAAALAKAAERGIIHRDIKPENIMLSNAGEVKVADFGLARLANDRDQAHLTQVGVAVGTPLYMSPEQVEGRPLDPRSDQYSFGVSCYHMLTGEPPFVGETPLAVAVQHVNREPRPLAALRPETPEALCRIVHKLLSKSPDDRYANPRDLSRDLRLCPIDESAADWVTNLSEAADAYASEVVGIDSNAATRQLQTAMTAAITRAAGARRRRSWWAVGLAVAFALGGAVAWYRREPFALAGAKDLTVPKQTSAEMQLFYAKLRDSEEWYTSVEGYFPEAFYPIQRSKQELARYYLSREQWKKALGVLAELEALESEPEFHAFGLAGEAFVYQQRAEYEKAAACLARLEPIKGNLKDRPMRQLVGVALEQVSKSVERESSKRWAEWAESLEEENASDLASDASS